MLQQLTLYPKKQNNELLYILGVYLKINDNDMKLPSILRLAQDFYYFKLFSQSVFVIYGSELLHDDF